LSEQRNREELAIRYLLGSLSEKERTTIEERFFADDKEFRELQIAEGELIDRYVRKELPAMDQQRFEQMLRTSPRLVKRVEFARILARQVPSPAPQQDDPEPAPVPIIKPKKDKREKRRWENLFGPMFDLSPAMRMALVAPLSLLLMMSVALVLIWTRLQTQSGRLAVEQQRLNNLEARLAEQKGKSDQLEAAVQQNNLEKEEQDKLLADYEQQLAELRRPGPASILPFELSPGRGTRGSSSGETAVPIPRGTQFVVLNLNVEDGKYSLYQASLQDINRKQIVPQRRIKPVRRGDRNVIPFRVPASQLVPGRSYSIHVDGLIASGEPEDFNDYPFRVTSR
jgi:hypothetical protein